MDEDLGKANLVKGMWQFQQSKYVYSFRNIAVHGESW